MEVIASNMALHLQCTEHFCAAHHCSVCVLVSPGAPPRCLHRPEFTLCLSLLIMASRQGAMFTQAWCQLVAWSGSGKVGASLLRFVPDQRGLRIRVVSVCGCITERVRLCFSMYFGGQRQEKLQWLTFPSFRGTQFQIIPCATVWVEIGSRDPTLLLCSADKPPTCGKIQRLKITRPRMIYKHATECIT